MKAKILEMVQDNGKANRRAVGNVLSTARKAG